MWSSHKPMLLVVIGLAFHGSPARAAEVGMAQEEAAASGEAQDSVRRGAYLVHRVAMCVQCHSPRTAEGELIASKLLSGGRIPVGRPYPNQPWALMAPRLAGLPGFEPEEVVQLLMEGKRPGGHAPRPPMPPFRLEQADAEAIVDYLRSIEP